MFCRQITITGTERKAIFGAHNRDANNLNIKAHISNHFADQRQLLKVLFTEAGDVRLDQVKQLADDSRHAAKMPRTAGAFQHGRKPWNVNVSMGFSTVRVDLFYRGRENQIHFALVQLFAVFLQGAGVPSQVLRAVELHRVNENTDDDHIGAGFGFVDQLHVAIMQVAHGRYQRHALAFHTQAANLLAQQWQGFDN